MRFRLIRQDHTTWIHDSLSHNPFYVLQVQEHTPQGSGSAEPWKTVPVVLFDTLSYAEQKEIVDVLAATTLI